MRRQSFHQRFEELPDIVGKDWSEIRDIIGMSNKVMAHIRYNDNASMTTVERVALSLGLIPVVLYRADGKPETLGIEDFLHGEPVDNYPGKVIAVHRELQELTPSELANKSRGIKRGRCVSRYENGAVAMIKSLEFLYDALGLTPHYLVQPQKERIRQTADKPDENVVKTHTVMPRSLYRKK